MSSLMKTFKVEGAPRCVVGKDLVLLLVFVEMDGLIDAASSRVITK